MSFLFPTSLFLFCKQASGSRYRGRIPGPPERLCYCHVCQSECHARLNWVSDRPYCLFSCLGSRARSVCDHCWRTPSFAFFAFIETRVTSWFPFFSHEVDLPSGLLLFVPRVLTCVPVAVCSSPPKSGLDLGLGWRGWGLVCRGPVPLQDGSWSGFSSSLHFMLWPSLLALTPVGLLTKGAKDSVKVHRKLPWVSEAWDAYVIIFSFSWGADEFPDYKYVYLF